MSLPKASYDDEDCNDFLKWLENKAGEKISIALTIRKSSYGRGLFASQFIQKGELILKVPFSVQLSPGNLPPNFSRLMGVEIDNAAKLAVVILIEKKLGQNSEWAPYINCLPLSKDMHSTIFWSDEELEMIQPSSLYQDTRKLKIHVEKNFLAIRSRFSDLFQFTLEEFIYAYGLVKSRELKNDKGVFSLIPFLDFVNHDNTSKARIWDDVDLKHSEITVDRDYAAGDEIRITYGKEKLSNALLLLNYGFAVFNNPRDFVLVEVSATIIDRDKLYTQKSDILQRQRISSKEQGNELTSWNVFRINQVPTGNREGERIPLLLRAFFRILVCDSEQELNELCEAKATKVDGRVARNPLKNTAKEIAAHQRLRDKISELMEKRNMINFQAPPIQLCEKGVVRRRLAELVLQGEVRVLKSACDWLDDYCSMLCKLKR